MIKPMGNSMNGYSTSMRIHENIVIIKLNVRKVTKQSAKGFRNATITLKK